MKSGTVSLECNLGAVVRVQAGAQDRGLHREVGARTQAWVKGQDRTLTLEEGNSPGPSLLVAGTVLRVLEPWKLPEQLCLHGVLTNALSATLGIPEKTGGFRFLKEVQSEKLN